MDLNKAFDSLKFDIRMRDWCIKHGLITREDLEKYLKSLDDYTGSCEPVTLEDKGDFAD